MPVHMTLTVRKAFRQNGNIYFLYFAAFCYLLFLVSSSQKDVFYSGDGGLKFMMIKQICAGEDFRYISHTQPGWVEEIWAQGFFPIRKVFVFPGPQGYLFVFSAPFEILSAFFYRQLGYTGLYIIPFFSLLLLWCWFIWLAKKLSFSNNQIFFLFFLLVFCSPLTLYGAIYWEHTLGMLLLFGGIVMLEYPPQKAWQAGILGCVSGLAIWVRPETFLINILFACALVILNYKKIGASHLLFIAGVLVGTASFLAFNKSEYGYFFGMHGFQALGEDGYLGKFRKALGNIYRMNLLLLRYFPIVLILVPIFCAWLKFKWPLPRRTIALLFIALIFWGGSPFIFADDGGKQWGPRFFLALIPMTLLIFGVAYQQWEKLDWQRYKTVLHVFIFLASCYGFYLNTFMGAIDLRDDNFNRIRPALDFVRNDPGNIVVVNNHFVTMEMSSLFKEKFFFLVDDTTSLNKLIPMLENKGVDHFIYVNFDKLTEGFARLLSSHHTKMINKGSYQVGLFPLNERSSPK